MIKQSNRALEHYDLQKKIEIIRKCTRLSIEDSTMLAKILDECSYKEIDNIIDAIIVIARRKSIKL